MTPAMESCEWLEAGVGGKTVLCKACPSGQAEGLQFVHDEVIQYRIAGNVCGRNFAILFKIEDFAVIYNICDFVKNQPCPI